MMENLLKKYKTEGSAMNKDFFLRTATKDDGDLIVNFQVAMALETEQLTLKKEVVKPGVMEILQQRVSRGEYWMVVKKSTSEVVACALWLPEWSEWRNGYVMWIHSVYVLPSERGKGIFRFLYQFLQERVCTDKQLKGLRLYVDKSNTSAQKVYERLGMNGNHYQLFEWIPS
jgi:ribosomal protein S18 acetylase RimI-like enzyme